MDSGTTVTDAYSTPDDIGSETLDDPELSDRERVRRLLLRGSEPRPWMTQLLEQALLTIILSSDGAVVTLKERIKGNGNPKGLAPRSGLEQEISALQRAYDNARNHRERFEVIKAAQAQARGLRKGSNPANRRGTPEWKARIVADPRSNRHIAHVFGISEPTVRRYKKAAAKESASPPCVERKSAS